MDIPHFNSPRISYSADGIGSKGVISQQLSFNVPSSEYGTTEGLFPYGSEVIVTCPGLTLPPFYVSSRKPNGASVGLVCYDRAMFTSAVIDFPDDDEKTEYIAVNTVLDLIKAACGFPYINTGDIIGSVITQIPKDSVKGRSVKSILTDLSQAAGGCFFVQENNSLAFLPAASGSFSGEFVVDKHERVLYGLSKSYEGVTIRNGDKTFKAGGGSAFNTLSFDSVLGTSSLAGALYSAVQGRTYTAWKCGNAIVTSYPAPGAGIKFSADADPMVCNFCQLKITPGGVFASFGRNDVSESDYESQYARDLSQRVKIGEINGSTKISRDGVKIVYINENEGKHEEYGFKGLAGGIAEFGGAMIDSTMPDEVKKISDTASEFRYGGITYQLSWEIDSDGKRKNIKLQKKE